MKNSNKIKSAKLKMSYGKASGILRKEIMFHLIKKCNMDSCFRCGEKITNVKELSIDHKTDWLYSDSPTDLFFDLNNISFSHLECNSAESRRKPKRVTGLSGFKGVRFRKHNKKYAAELTINI